MRVVVLVLAACVVASGAAAQGLPSEPVTLGGGRVVIGGNVAASIAPEDTGFFNYADYEYSALRQVRIGLTWSVRANDHFSFLGEVRTENFDDVRAFALFVRM